MYSNDAVPNDIFPVEIEKNKVVGDLKEDIKKKQAPEFDDIPADKLVLFQVSIPVDDNVEERLKKHPSGKIPVTDEAIIAGFPVC